MPQKKWQSLLRRAFPLSTVLFVLSATLSVNYYGGCNPTSYDKLVENRDYIISKNQEQISQSLNAIVWSVALWSVIILVCLLAIQRGKTKSGTSPHCEEPAKSLHADDEQIEGPLYEVAGQSAAKNRASHTFILPKFLQIRWIDIEPERGLV